MRRLDVDLGERAYPILIGHNIGERLALVEPFVRGGQLLVVTNPTVGALYADALIRVLEPRFRVRRVDLPDGEQHKHLDSAAQVLDALAGFGATRDATVIALGGGVVGDLAGFAAAMWMRGIDFLQMPTTLLAMVDSSVGGKTGVNHVSGKNLIGAFHQPVAVVADLARLKTLPEREYRAGLAEVLKYGAIRDVDFFAWLEQHAAGLVARDPELLAEAVEQSCRHKAQIVIADEREQGERALLNFGHTYGHAIENLCGYGAILHGEAVAIGMSLAAQLSARLELAPHADAERLDQLIAAFGLPCRLPPQLSPEAMLAAMRLDKKSRADGLRLILWRGLGRAEQMSGICEQQIIAELQSHRQSPAPAALISAPG